MVKLLCRKTLISKNWYQIFSASYNIGEKLEEILEILFGKFNVAIFEVPQDKENSHILQLQKNFSSKRNKLRFVLTIKVL